MKGYRHAFISDVALESISSELHCSWLRETGGVLCGYVTVDQALVITHASGPDQISRRGPFWFGLSGDFASAYCREVEDLTEGRSYFIGDWHSHLAPSVTPSLQDIQSMKELIGVPPEPCKIPVCMITTIWPIKHALYSPDALSPQRIKWNRLRVSQ